MSDRDRDAMIDHLLEEENAPVLMALGKTRHDLLALSEDELLKLIGQMRQIDEQLEPLMARGGVLVNQYIRLKKQLRDLEAEHDDLVRRLREEFSIDCDWIREWEQLCAAHPGGAP